MARVLGAVSAIGAVCGVWALGAGCSVSPAKWFGFSSGTADNTLVTASAAHGTTYTPQFTTAIYRYIDASAADIYLTDLPVSRLADRDDPLSDVTGTLIHIHLFLIPQAGSTPIDPTACTAAVRQFVFAGADAAPKPTAERRAGEAEPPPAIGVYAGGAFVTPSDDKPGKPTLSGTVRGGTLRLVQVTPGFVDALGPSTLRGTFVARNDDAAGRAIGERLVGLVGVMTDYTAPLPPGYADAIKPPAQRRAESPAGVE